MLSGGRKRPSEGRSLDAQGAVRAARGALCLLLHLRGSPGASRAARRARHHRERPLHALDDYDPDTLGPLVEVIRGTRTTLLGLCGGHQLIGLASAPPGALDRLAPGEGEPRPALAAGMRRDGARPRAELRKRSLAGLAETVVVEQRHFWELKGAPAGFVRLSASDACPVQRSVTKAGCSTASVRPGCSDRHPEGRTIHSNFFRLAGLAVPRSEAAALARAEARPEARSRATPRGPERDRHGWAPVASRRRDATPGRA